MNCLSDLASTVKYVLIMDERLGSFFGVAKPVNGVRTNTLLSDVPRPKP